VPPRQEEEEEEEDDDDLEHVDTFCGRNVEIFNVKLDGTYSYRCVQTR
jgi:hypothetical protein